MSSLTISDRRSLANVARELGPPVRRVRRLEVRPKEGAERGAEVIAELPPHVLAELPDATTRPPATPRPDR